MRIYWYWPHPHAAASSLALSVLRPGDSLTVQALPTLHGRSFRAIEEYTVVRDLPDPTATTGAQGCLVPRRLALSCRRSLARHRILGNGFDVAHIENLVYQTDWLDLRLLRRRVPLVSMVHDIRPHRSNLPPSLELQLLRELYRQAGRLIVYHQVLKDELVGDLLVEPSLVHVVPIPIMSKQPRRLEQRSERPILLFFGALRENKGIRVLIRALASLSRPNFTVTIAGDGPEAIRRELREAVGHLPFVDLELGFASMERKAELFSAASGLLLPYTSFHSQSGVLADAYAYRRPLIASDVGALGPTVRADGTGIVIEPGDPDTLAEAMIRLAMDGGASWSHALETAAESHSYEAVGAQLRDIYGLAATS